MRSLFRLVLLLIATTLIPPLSAQQMPLPDNAADAHQALTQAMRESATARIRAEKLESDAALASQAAEQTAQKSAALAARIQQAEADISGQEAQIRLIAEQRNALRVNLASRQRPLVRLTAALQRLSRRPLAIALLRPGSVQGAVHMRALIETMIPEVQRRTADLRGEIARSRALQTQAQLATSALRNQQSRLQSQKQALAALETQQRLAARQVSGSADREAEHALALAEQARDLTSLTQNLGKLGELREELALLPGPVLRPTSPNAPTSPDNPITQTIPTAATQIQFQLPMAGRLLTGFGGASHGINLAVRGGAQAVAPAAGRVAFAGPYRGYGNIIIIAHDGGYTSLITGLAQLNAQVGDSLISGSPLGSAGPTNPIITLELRRYGQVVNPLDYLKTN